MIEIKNVHKAFADQKVLRGVDILVKKGSSTAIIGTSGGGKSVLLKILLGLIKPDSGEVYIKGEYVSSKMPTRTLSNIGMLFQGSALFDSLPVWQNICFKFLKGREKLSTMEAKSLAIQKLEQVGLNDEVANKFPADLSGGMKKRVAIARAIAGNRPLLLADEPTGNLDIASGKEVLQLFKDLCHDEDDPISILMVTHDPELALNADRMLLLKDGTTEASDIRTAWGLDELDGEEE